MSYDMTGVTYGGVKRQINVHYKAVSLTSLLSAALTALIAREDGFREARSYKNNCRTKYLNSMRKSHTLQGSFCSG